MDDDNKTDDKEVCITTDHVVLDDKATSSSKFRATSAHISKLCTSFDKAFEQLKEMDSLVAKALSLNEDQTAKFVQIRKAYAQFVNANEKSQNQKLTKVLESFQGYCATLDTLPNAHPPFSKDITYYQIAKIIFDTRLNSLKDFLKERNRLLFSNPNPTPSKRK